MSQAIVERIISSVADRRLVLGNSQAARYFTARNNWTKARVGIRFGFNPQGNTSNMSGIPRLAFGFCRLNDTGLPESVEVSNLYGDATCDHFLGLRTNQATWTYNANSGDPYMGNVTARATRRLTTTDTDFGLDTFTSVGFTMEPDAHRTGLFIDVLKGSPNYSLWYAYPNNNGIHAEDLTVGQFLQMMEVSAFSSGSVVNAINSRFTNTTTAQTLVCDEGAPERELNGFGVFWDRTSYLLEISDVAFSIITA